MSLDNAHDDDAMGKLATLIGEAHKRMIGLREGDKNIAVEWTKYRDFDISDLLNYARERTRQAVDAPEYASMPMQVITAAVAASMTIAYEAGVIDAREEGREQMPQLGEEQLLSVLQELLGEMDRREVCVAITGMTEKVAVRVVKTSGYNV